MRIKIHSDKCRLNLVIPTSWVLNRLSAGIIAKAVNGKTTQITLTNVQVYKMFQAVRRCRRDYPGLKLVEVKSAEGDIVEVSL